VTGQRGRGTRGDKISYFALNRIIEVVQRCFAFRSCIFCLRYCPSGLPPASGSCCAHVGHYKMTSRRISVSYTLLRSHCSLSSLVSASPWRPAAMTSGKATKRPERMRLAQSWVRAGLLPPKDAAKSTQFASAVSRSAYRFLLDPRCEGTSADQKRHEPSAERPLVFLQTPALNQPTPLMALVVSAMNDVLNPQGYTQAAW